MAQRMEIQFIDDIDGGPANTTLSFAIDGTAYEIDLSTAHAQELRSALQPYLATARRVGGPARRAARPARPGSGKRANGPSPAAVREWARAEGIKVSERGRVPAELVVKFQQADV
jgi:hypothetical protein